MHDLIYPTTVSICLYDLLNNKDAKEIDVVILKTTSEKKMIQAKNTGKEKNCGKNSPKL